MTEDQIERMIEKAAEAAAKNALRDIGLHDADAIHDLREVRELLDSWRMAKQTAGRAIVQTFTYLFLGALLAGSYFKLLSSNEL